MAKHQHESRSRTAAVGGFIGRARRSWVALEREQRTAGFASMLLFVTMFLPWYSRSAVGVVKGEPVKVDDTLTAFGSFSFVEAAVLLVAVGILWMLFARGEGKAFHLPFGDGNVIFAAGLWICALVFYRQFDKPAADTAQGLATNIGVSWGIFVTFMVGLFLAFSGQRLRVAHVAEPPLPGEVSPSDEPRRSRPDRRRPARAASDDWDDENTAATRVPEPPSGRPRPRGDASQTVVDRRGPTVDETLMADIPEFPPRRTPPARPADTPTPDPPTGPTTVDPATGPTRVVRGGDQLRLDDEGRSDGDGQLRFDGD